jgi:hypothetical protein
MASLEFNAALAMSLTSSTFESIAVSLFRLENDASSVLLQEARVSKIAVANVEADLRLNKFLIVFIRVIVGFVI